MHQKSPRGNQCIPLELFINKKIERRQVSNLSKNISAFQLYKHVIILQLICQ